MARELIALVKHDCPVCDQVLPALDAAGVLGMILDPTAEREPVEMRALAPTAVDALLVAVDSRAEDTRGAAAPA